MNENLTEWKPEDAVNAVRDRIRAEFVAIIPPETFTQMVRAEIERFTKNESRSTSGYRYEASNFGDTVRDVLREETRQEVKKLLGSSEWQSHWNGDKRVASEMVRHILAEHGAEIINQFLANLLGQALQNSSNAMLAQLNTRY